MKDRNVVFALDTVHVKIKVEELLEVNKHGALLLDGTINDVPVKINIGVMDWLKIKNG